MSGWSEFADELRAQGTAWSAPVVPPTQLEGIFDELPVPLDTFVTDDGYLANPKLSPIQYETVQFAERIYFGETYELLKDAPDPKIAAYWQSPYRPVNFITLEWGKGSGKDHICRIVSLRIAYLLLCLKSPQRYYSMPEQDTIHLLNVASSSKQASRAFFAPMRRAVTRPGGWFRTQGVQIKEVGSSTRAQRDAQAAQALQDTIRFAKNIEAISGHSDAESQEGLNLMLGIADEIDAFRRRAELARYHTGSERDSTRSAEGIIDMLKGSSRTRFPGVFKNVYISYPRYLGSMIQVLEKEAREDNEAKGEKSANYVSGPYATWEVNPRVPGKEAFQDDYDKDPIFSAAKYECKPSRALNPYFTNVIAIEACEAEVERQPLKIDYKLNATGTAWDVDWDFGSALRPIQGAIYAMHADLAVTGDRAGISLAHCMKQAEYTVLGQDEKGKDIELHEFRPVVRVDFVASFSAKANVTPPREIQIRWARNLCFEMRRRGFNIRRFTFDGFQSTDSMQILEINGIESERVSTDMSEDPWRTLRDLFAEDRIEMPERESTHDELLSLSRMPNGKIDHPPDGSKDEADALAGAVLGAVLLGGMEDPDGRTAHLADNDWPMGIPVCDIPTGSVVPNRLTPLSVQRVEVDAPGALLSFAEGFAIDLTDTCMKCQAGIKMVSTYDGKFRCPGCGNTTMDDVITHQQ